MFHTSYLARVKKISNNTIPVFVCRYMPISMSGSSHIHCPMLSPDGELLRAYKNNDIDIGTLKNKYEGYLNNNKEKIICLVNSLIDEHINICFVCYEKDVSMCHREVLAKFLTENGFEYGGEI